MSNTIEHRVIQRILSGEKDAFRYFVREYQQQSYAVALSIVKDEDDAKDVVQNAFIRAYKSIRSFRQDSSFKTWMYRITVNEALKLNKKNKKTFTSVNIEDEHDTIGSTFNAAMQNIQLDEQRTLIKSILQKLKPKESLLLNLYYIEELSLNEIQESTGFSTSNIKVLLFRARKAFMKLYLTLNVDKYEYVA